LMNREVGRIRIHESQTPFVFVFMRERQLTIQGLLIVFMTSPDIFMVTTMMHVRLCWRTSALGPRAALAVRVPGPGLLVNRSNGSKLRLDV
jgi:hypothetical protein